MKSNVDYRFSGRVFGAPLPARRPFPPVHPAEEQVCYLCNADKVKEILIMQIGLGYVTATAMFVTL